MDAPKQLKAFLEDNGITQAEAARALSVSDVTVWQWVQARLRPRSHHRSAIERWTKGLVPADGWLKDEEREAVEAIEPFDSSADPDGGEAA